MIFSVIERVKTRFFHMVTHHTLSPMTTAHCGHTTLQKKCGVILGKKCGVKHTTFSRQFTPEMT